jgi:hypothetical protein
MYAFFSNRLLARAVVLGLLLQGCGSSFQMNSEGFSLKKSSKTDDDAPFINQALVPGAQSSVPSDVSYSEPLTATTLLSVATSTVPVTLPTCHHAVGSNTVSSREKASSAESGETDTRLAAQVGGCSSVGCLASLCASPFLVPAPVFGAWEWARYFGEVGVAPPLLSDIDKILNAPCPFWLRKRVRDTHLLVLIPATVAGRPFSLNLLGELIRHPKGGGHPAEYDDYDSDLHEQFGTKSPGHSYWVLMTRNVIEDSRRKAYTSQQVLVACHANRTGLPYELPSALEAATAILSHYVRSGERLYADNPWTWTLCQELVAWDGGNAPVVVGGFSSGGLNVTTTTLTTTTVAAGWRISSFGTWSLGTWPF